MTDPTEAIFARSKKTSPIFRIISVTNVRRIELSLFGLEHFTLMREANFPSFTDDLGVLFRLLDGIRNDLLKLGRFYQLGGLASYGI